MWHLGASKMNFRDAHNLFPSCAHALKSIAPCLGAVWVRRCFCTLVPSLGTVCPVFVPTCLRSYRGKELH